MLAGDRRDLGAVAYVDAQRIESRLPAAEDGFTRAGRKTQVAAQRHHGGFSHHVLAFLVTLDRVGGFVAAFKQQVFKAKLLRMCGRTQSRRPGTDDDQFQFHGLPKAAAPDTVVPLCASCRL